MIGFIGSVFSPWYHWSRRRNPQNHVCINVATYGPGSRFTMTDRGADALRQSRDRLQVGPSAMRWTGGQIVVEVNEVSAPPIISPVRGTVTLTPAALFDRTVALTPDNRHVWRPIAPIARVEVDLTQGHRWSGHGYFDSNAGSAALQADFDFWTWGRFPRAGGTTCFYDATRRDGSTLATALHFTAEGEVLPVEAPPLTKFRRSRWGVRRETRADSGTIPRQVLNMLDAPFYSRSQVHTRIAGEDTAGVHEALDLRRFDSALLMPMLALRVPRRPGWQF